tara:strand:+ start:518 stop:856 length:339 start_codon:yes stop_codon:yes gene_type:complete
MSQPFIIKCVKCKGEFDETLLTAKRVCTPCMDKRHEDKRQELKRKRAENHISEYVINCKFCKNDFMCNSKQRMYCSRTCCTKFWNIPKDITRTEAHIDRLILKVEHLRSLVD